MHSNTKRVHLLKRFYSIGGNQNQYDFLPEKSLELNILSLKNYYQFSNKNYSFHNIIYLELENCRITKNSFILNIQNGGLQELYLKHNPLDSIEFLNNIKPRNLLNLDISNTNVKIIDRKSSEYLFYLEKFFLENCPIASIEIVSSHLFKTLIVLNAFGIKSSFNDLLSISKNLENSKNVNISNYYFCCLLWKYHPSKHIKCKSLETWKICSNLVGGWVDALILWGVASVTTAGNICTITISILTPKKDQKLRWLKIFSDNLLSFCWLSLASADKYYGKNFVENNENWKNNIFCKLIGPIFNFAIINEVLISLLISIERYFVVKNPLKKPKISKNENLIMTVALMISIMLTFFPLIYDIV